MIIAVGIDVHKKTSSAYAVYAGRGEENEKHTKFLESFNNEFRDFPSTPEKYQILIAFVQGHECNVLIENSTKAHEVYWILRNGGVKVVAAHSTDLYRITKSVKKTDHHDSVELAGYMKRRIFGEAEFSESFIPSPEWMLKREMCRGVLAEKVYLANTKRRLRAHLLLHGITLRREYDDISSRFALAEMNLIKDPYLRMLARFAGDAKNRVSMGESAIAQMFSGDRTFELIDSITGFGHTSAAYMSSLIVDIERFRSSSEFTASFGVVPRMRSSGESNPNCSTTHRGDDLMRKRLMECTGAHIRFVKDSVVTAMYNRLVNNGKPKREALVAASRKLLTVVWSVLRSGRPYSSDPESLRGARTMEDSSAEN
jgi:transposase